MVSTLETFNCTTHTPLPVLDRSGRSNCFNCIIETFQTQAYNLARRMLDDWVLAEDAVQESLISAYRAFHNYWGDNLKAWLMRIVANTCRDMMRARRSRPTSPLDPLPADSEGPNRMPSAVDLPSGEESPEAAAERGELNRAIQNGLNSLQEEQRLAVALVDIQGLSYEEVALAIGCSLGTVKSRVSRGRRGLRDFLQGIGELLPSRFRHSE
ncbi:MAG: sigma-70 family RNA polymerase sigma factor [Dehalococcoidia bacterium]|nr:sigma-70 family RNA polymerase sigma factor [Dehalococcoidia bacterium]